MGSEMCIRDRLEGDRFGGIDALSLVETILSLPIRTRERELTVYDCLRVSSVVDTGTTSLLASKLGVRMESDCILIASKSATLNQSLSRFDPMFRDVDVGELLLHIDGASRTNNAMSFGGLRKRAIRIPIESLPFLDQDLLDSSEPDFNFGENKDIDYDYIH